MSVAAILVLVVGLYLVLKVAGLVFKLALIVLVLGGLFWLTAPFLGIPSPF